MDHKTITIQTNTEKKDKLDQRSFSCQILELGKTRTYVLDETKNDLTRKRFSLTPGCRVFDDGVMYIIQDIHYWPKPMYPFLIVSTQTSIPL